MLYVVIRVRYVHCQYTTYFVMFTALQNQCGIYIKKHVQVMHVQPRTTNTIYTSIEKTGSKILLIHAG